MERKARKKGADAMSALRASAMGASAGMGDAKTIAATLTSVLDAYGLSASTSQHQIDVLTQAVKLGKGEADLYAAAFAKVIPIASQAGVSFEEVAAQMASATRVGLNPSETATALRQIFNNLIDPSEKAKKAMKSLGTSVEEIRSKLKTEGLFKTLEDLMNRSGGKIGPITELFGNIRALTGFLATTGKGTLEEYRKTLQATMNPDGSTLEAAKINAGGLAFQLDKLQAAAQKAAIAIGDRLLPAVTDFVTGAAKDIPNVLKTWDALPTTLKQVIGGLVGMLALSGPLFLLSGTVKILGSMLMGLGKFVFIAQGLGAAAGAAGLTGGLLATLAIAVAALGASVAYVKLKEKMDETTQASDELTARTANLTRELEKAANAANAGGGSEKSKKGVAELSEKLAEAGGDTTKLMALLKEATEKKVEIGKDMKLSPIGKAVAQNELQKFINDLSSMTIGLKVSVDGQSQAAARAAVNALTGAGTVDEKRNAVSSTVIDKTEAGWQSRARAAGLQIVPLSSRPSDKVQEPSSVANLFGLTAGQMRNDTAVARWAAMRREQQQKIEAWERAHPQVVKIRDFAASHSPVLQSKAVVAALHQQREAVEKLTDAELKREQVRITALANAGNLKLGNPNFDADASVRGVKIEEEMRRRHEKRQKAKDIQADVDSETSDAKAKDAAAAAQAAADELASRQSAALQKQLGKQQQMWDSFGSLVEGTVGRMRALEEAGGKVGEKTAKAKVEAELLKRAYDGIPQPLKDSLVQLAAIEYRMQKMLGLRDGLRELFGGIFVGLTKEARGEFAAFTANFGKRLNLGGQFANAQRQERALASPLIGTAENARKHLSDAQEQIGAQRKANNAFEGGGSLVDTARQYLGKDGSNARTTGKAYGLEWCVGFIQARRQELGLSPLAGGDLSVNGVRSWGKKQGLQTNDPQAGDVFTINNGKQRHAAIVASRSGNRVTTIGGNEGGIKDNKKSLVKEGATYNINAPGVMFFRPDGSVPTVQAPASAKGPMPWLVKPNGTLERATSPTPTQAPTVPTIDTTTKRNAALPNAVPLDDRTLIVGDMPKGWGGMVRDMKTRAGEVTDARRAMESFFQKQISEGATFKDGDLFRARMAATAADMDASTQRATESARGSIADMGRQIRLAGQENNPYAVLLESFEHGENKALSGAGRKAFSQMTLGLMVEQGRQSVKQAQREAAKTIGTNNEVAGQLTGGNFNQGIYDRDLFSAQKRREIWSQPEIDGLFKSGKAIEANAQAMPKLNAALAEFDSNRRQGGLLEYAQGLTGHKDTMANAALELRLLKENRLTREQINDQLEIEKTRRDALAKFNVAFPGDIAGNQLKANEAATNKGSELSAAHVSAAQDERNQYGDAQARAQSDLKARRLYAGAFAPDDPELQLQLQKLQKSAELEKENRDKADSGGIDIPLRMKAYEKQIRAEAEITRIGESKNRVIELGNSLLDEQSNRVQSLAKSESARLEIALQLEAAKREGATKKETPDETAARQALDNERRLSAAQRDRLELGNSLLDARMAREMELVNVQIGGAQKRLEIEMRYDALRRGAMSRAETQEEANARVQLEGEKRASAAQTDRLSRLKQQGEDVKGVFRSILDGDTKSIGAKLTDQVKDYTASNLTRMALGKDASDGQPTGILDLLGWNRKKTVATPGINGDVTNGGIAGLSPQLSAQATASGAAGDVMGALTSMFGRGLTATSVTIATPTATVNAFNANVNGGAAGGSSGAGLGALVGLFGGGRNDGGSGSTPTTIQKLESGAITV